MKARITTSILILILVVVSLCCHLFVFANPVDCVNETVFSYSQTQHDNDVERSCYSNILKNMQDLVCVEETKIADDDFEMYGNTRLSEKDFRTIVANGENKVYFHYRTNREIDLTYDALLVIKTQEKTFSYEFLEKKDVDSETIKCEIRDFLEKYSCVLQSSYFMEKIENHEVENSSIPTTFINAVVEREYVTSFRPYGSIVYHIGVSRYTANSDSILFIVTVATSFVPGWVANNNHESGYDTYRNKSGFVHMNVAQAFDANEEHTYGIRHGNIPYKKDYWPINNEPAVVTVSSSLQPGVNLGYSYTNGFGLDNVIHPKNHTMGLNVSYAFSKAITGTEPALSVQPSSERPGEQQWSYLYETSAQEAYHLTTNYMFEISNSRNEMFIGDFRLKLDFKFGVRYLPILLSPQQFNETSADLMVRAGEYNEIYNFCNGLI